MMNLSILAKIKIAYMTVFNDESESTGDTSDIDLSVSSKEKDIFQKFDTAFMKFVEQNSNQSRAVAS